VRRLRYCLVACLLAAAYDLSAQTPPGEAQSLTPGRVIRRLLKFGEIHVYRVALERGQFLRVNLPRGEKHAHLAPGRTGSQLHEQAVNSPGGEKHIQIGIQAFDPDGRELISVHNNTVLDEPEVEVFLLIAEATGVHRLELRSLDKPEMAGAYSVAIKELRPATERDWRAT
jgi:hypothetical protein